ncbi:MAG: STAS/SEC14 domain-containing protein [Desulfuromusa sp.]
MLKHELLHDKSILIVVPEAPLEAQDFEDLNREIDPYIAETGRLKGLMIYTESFPGWETFAAFISHLKFVKNHHQQIGKVAAVTDSGFLAILPRVASHFVQAEIRHFSWDDKEKALDWLESDSD